MSTKVNKSFSGKRKVISSKSEDIFLSPTTSAIYTGHRLQDSLYAVRDVTKSLSLGIASVEPLIKSYQNILQAQDGIYKTVADIGARLSNETARFQAIPIIGSEQNKNLLHGISQTVGTVHKLYNNNIAARLITETSKFQSVLTDVVTPSTNFLASVGLATSNAVQLHQSGIINTSAFKESQRLSALALDTIKDQQIFIPSFLRSIRGSIAVESTYRTNQLASMHMVSNGFEAIMQSLPTYPAQLVLPSLEITREAGEITEEELSEHQKNLDKLLKKINPTLVDFRRGAWDAFRAKKRDYIGQASSSMRRLVDNLLREIAPQKKVKQTQYFKDSPKAKDQKGSPTRKARVLYVVEYDQKKAAHLERLADGFLEAYANLSAWDHAPLQQDIFVHGVLITIEGYLLSLLSGGKK